LFGSTVPEHTEISQAISAHVSWITLRIGGGNGGVTKKAPIFIAVFTQHGSLGEQFPIIAIS
jgi:hypothetical protein